MRSRQWRRSPAPVIAVVDGAKRFALERIPMGRIGLPKDVAEAVAFLVSPRSTWINGATLRVGGAPSITDLPYFEENWGPAGMFEWGVDTLCYHRQIVAGMPLDQVMEEVASLEVGWIQINRYHLRGEESLAQVTKLGERARELDLRVTWSGDSLGQASWQLPKGLETIQTGIRQAVASHPPEASANRA